MLYMKYVSITYLMFYLSHMCKIFLEGYRLQLYTLSVRYIYDIFHAILQSNTINNLYLWIRYAKFSVMLQTVIITYLMYMDLIHQIFMADYKLWLLLTSCLWIWCARFSLHAAVDNRLQLPDWFFQFHQDHKWQLL